MLYTLVHTGGGFVQNQGFSKKKVASTNLAKKEVLTIKVSAE